MKLAAGDRRAGEIDGERWREMARDAVGWMRRRGSRQSGLKLEAASAMGEPESRTRLNKVSASSDGGGGGLGARRATAQRSARRLGGMFRLDDCDGTVGVERREGRGSC